MKQFDEGWVMEKFYEWWGNKDIPAEYLESALLDAFQAGMLAAADIAEQAHKTVYSHGNITIGKDIAREIRNACKDDG